jgi:uncharacterized repeat protein (TIGR03803 family)
MKINAFWVAAWWLAAGVAGVAAPTFQTLVHLQGPGPSQPHAGLTEGPDGKLYGASTRGGTLDVGTIFSVTTSGSLAVVVDLTGTVGPRFGGEPLSAPIVDGTFGFLGVTVVGGTSDFGTIYTLTKSGVYTPQIQFSNQPGAVKGSLPVSAPFLASDNNLYGTTVGGSSGVFGTVYRIAANGIFSTLVEFTGTGGARPGAFPNAGLVEGADGALYGVTGNGGAFDRGMFFRLTKSGSYAPLFSFSATAGANPGSSPTATPLLASDGNFYGTTEGGGTHDCGTLYRVTPAGVHTVLVHFTGTTGTALGRFARSPLVEDGSGNLYGTTYQGGTGNRGTIFRLAPDGTFTTLHDLDPSGIQGALLSYGGLLLRPDGALYGTSAGGGQFGVGTIFRLNLLEPGNPDALVAKVRGSGTSAPLGDGVINTSGSGQSVAAKIPVGATKTFEVTVQNDGASEHAFRVQGPGSDKRFKVRYFDDAGQEITSAVVAGTYEAINIPVAGSAKLAVKVKATGASVGRAKAIRVTAIAEDSGLSDTVEVRVAGK